MKTKQLLVPMALIGVCLVGTTPAGAAAAALDAGSNRREFFSATGAGLPAHVNSSRHSLRVLESSKFRHLVSRCGAATSLPAPPACATACATTSPPAAANTPSGGVDARANRAESDNVCGICEKLAGEQDLDAERASGHQREGR